MRAILYLTSATAALLLAYAFFEQDIPKIHGHRELIIFLVAVLATVSILMGRFFGQRARNFVVSAQLSLLSLLTVLALTEVLFRIVPDIFPDNVRTLVKSRSASASTRQQVVEFLPHSPYAKPRANVTIHVPGYYGPKDSFVYEWTTDRRGFKNSSAVAGLDKVDVVALGSSFTEAMGVAVEDTWASKLSKLGHVTYSLGVEGYAPTQFSGAYEYYGRVLKPKWVIIGYVVNDFYREIYFPENRAQSDQKLPSAIGRLVEGDNIDQQNPIYLETKEGYRIPIPANRHHTFVTSALVTLAKKAFEFYRSFDIRGGTEADDSRFLSDKAVAESASGPLKFMPRYRGDLLSLAATHQTPDEIVKNPQWTSTEKAFEHIIDMARQDHTRVLILFLPSRAPVYFERAMGRPLHADSEDSVQVVLLKSFAQRHGVEMLDLNDPLRDYVATLNETSTIEQYPFLKVDGHASVKGNELIAAEVARFLSQNESAVLTDAKREVGLH